MVTHLLSDAVDTLIYLEPFVWLLVILSKLLGNVGTNVTKFLLQE